MPLVKILMAVDATVPAVVDARTGATVKAEASFACDSRPVVDSETAFALVGSGQALFVEVPVQDGLPRGCMDAFVLETRLKAAESAAPTRSPVAAATTPAATTEVLP